MSSPRSPEARELRTWCAARVPRGLQFMRHDVAGLFWDDTRPPKKLKIKEKSTPPDPAWLADDDLPGLADALSYNPPTYTDAELLEAQQASEPLLFDVEAFRNYFLCSFMGYHTGKVVEFEMDDFGALDLKKLRWVFTSFTIVGFNSM